MKKYMGIFLMLLTGNVVAANTDAIVSELQKGNISLATLANLESLDKRGNRIGYGLCKAARREGCVLESSIGYGLCSVANRDGCITNGSLGYGLCKLSKRNDCVPNGSLGYGICMLNNHHDCVPN